MAAKLAWAITGAGDLLSQCFDQMEALGRGGEWRITAMLSKAAATVLKYYKLEGRLQEIAEKVILEKDSNTPFIVGALQTGKYDTLLVAPLTANSTAKIALGLADTLITNAVAQANKAGVPIILLPVDQKPGTITTDLPGGGKLELTMRPVDIENAERLKRMPGINVVSGPEDIPGALAAWEPG